MSRTLKITDALEAYVARLGARVTPAQVRCREETAGLPMAQMQIGPDRARSWRCWSS